MAPHQRNAAVPRPLSVIVMRCLAKQPTERYSSANVLADDLQRFLSGQVISAPPASNKTRRTAAIALGLLLLLRFVSQAGSCT